MYKERNENSAGTMFIKERKLVQDWASFFKIKRAKQKDES